MIKNQSFSISFNEKTSSNGSTFMIYLSQGKEKEEQGLHIGWYSNYLRFSFYGSAFDTYPNYPIIEEWRHWVVTYDNKTNSRCIYMNGKLVQSDTHESFKGSGKFILGTTAWLGKNYFKGVLDEIRIYNKKLTDTDITMLYANDAKIDLIAEAEKEKLQKDEASKKELEYQRKQEENRIKEIERLSIIKSQIENRTFTGSHYYDYGNYKYTGSFINGIANGQGKWEKADGSWYEGQFKDGVENGIGTLRQVGGLRYTGNFTNGYPNGKFKIERWTLMGLARDEWTAEYKDGNLINSSQTESGMSDFLNSQPTTSSSSNSKPNGSSGDKNCEWKLISKSNNSAEFKNSDKGTKKMLWEYKKAGIDGSYPHYLISGTAYFGTEARYFNNNGGDVRVGDNVLGTASSLDEAIILLLKYKFCK